MDIILVASNIYTAEFATRVEVNSEISQTAQNINLSVDQKLLNYSTTSQMNAAIDIKANQITSTVSQTYATKLEMNSAITQTSDSIMLEVNQKMDEDDFTHAEIVAKINDNTSQVQITADKINLTGYLTVSSASSTYATKSGLSNGTTTINGGCITTGSIQSSNYESGVAGTKIQLSNGVIDSKNFKINSSGNVTVNGTVTARSGYIGNGSQGWTIANTALWNNKNSLTADTEGVYIGTTGISLGKGSTFKVTPNGAVTCSNINATGGTIGGCSINNGVLTIDNINVNSINGGKITGTGTMSGGIISTGSLNGNRLINGTVDNDKITSLSADKIYGQTLSVMDLVGSSSITTTGRYYWGNLAGQTYNLIVQHEGQYWRRLRFVGGILIGVDENW